MSADYPDWLVPPTKYPLRAGSKPKVEIVPAPPEDLSRISIHTTKPPRDEVSEEERALKFVQFEMVLPRILERICAGETVNAAVKELVPLVEIDLGGFMRWLKKNPTNYALFKEAKEVRTEVWAGKMIDHATGASTEDGIPTEISRDKLAIDTYWKLMGAENRGVYGDTKTIEVTGGISITAALEQGRSRVLQTQLVDDVDLLNARQIRELPSPDDEDDD